MNRSTMVRLKKSRIGSILVLTAISSLFLIGMAAMVTDVGTMYYNQARLQTAVNAGWKAGYDKMMLLKSSKSGPLSSNNETLVRNHVFEVMKANGYTDDEMANVLVTFPATNRISVTSTQKVGLFFARAMDFKEANVAAGRANHVNDSGATIIPLAIPHGVVKDLSKSTYAVSMFSGTDGFASGSEYIIKLGSGGGGGTDVPSEDPDYKAILVPMGPGDQSSYGYLRAYGAAFWCLRIDENDTGAFTPVNWLLGYRGGSFLLPYDGAIISILNSYSVNYTVIVGSEDVQAIYDAVNPNILELHNRPRIAVYTSQGDPDPVMLVLQDGKIPYGTYSLPRSMSSNGWRRNDKYSSSKCGHLYDNEILGGALDDYHWLHLHHEDFTGFSGGCSYFWYDCRYFYDKGWLGSTSNQSKRLKCKNKMCSYCRAYFNYKTGSWGTWDGRNSSAAKSGNPNCKNMVRRCVDKYGSDGVPWRDDSDIYICNKGNLGYPQCWQHNLLRGIADTHGYTSDANSEPKPYYYVNPNGSQPLPDNPAGYFDDANKVQKMKWEVVRKVKAHVNDGGFLFAQCFAPETFDIALWQSAIHDGATPLEAYANCVAFENFHYKTFPRYISPTWYSNINTRSGKYKFNLLLPLDPRCQNHSSGYDCNTWSGHTASFRAQVIKPSCTILGYQSNTSNSVKYLKGTIGKGDFTFLGGHSHKDVYSKRLVLNNILLGSLVNKETSGGGTPVTGGKTKSNYGPIDPDNTNGGGANDYRDRFKYGFTGALQLGDRITPEHGNMVGPTNQGVDFKVNGDASTPPGRLVILPITDVGPEVPVNNSKNADATTIYDLQGNDHPNGAYDPNDYNFGSSIRIVGFAEFRILDPSEYSRDGTSVQAGDAGDLGSYQSGQVRAEFVRYIVKPGDVPVN